MMVKMADTREFTEAYVSVRGGTRLIDRRPEFSRDAKFLVCCSGPNLKVLSVASGECVHVLHGHTKQVTGVKLNPQNPYQILSCSLDKSIIKWDYADGILVKRYKMNATIYALYTTSITDDAYLYAVCKKSNKSSLVRFRLPRRHELIPDSTIIISNIHPVENHTAVSAGGQFAASVDIKKLIVCDTNTLTTTVHKLDIPRYNTELSVRFTCVACHPSENCIASGINDGRIVLWYNVLKKNAVTSIMHWHFVSLHDLAFTKEGSYLLSGGSECVLVKWQWNTNQKDFLPRLKSPIVFICCSHDNTHYALCHKDNGIQVVTSNFHMVHLYQGLTQASLELDTEFGIIAGLHQDPRSKALVTNGKQGYLQFYDIFNDKLKFNMDVVSQNFPTPENLMHPHTVTKIECVAFDSTGDWLATVERWDDGQMTPEIRLKFWVYVSEKHNYKLNTMVEMPHKQKVHVVKFRPTSQNSEDAVAMAITASSDGTFKTWCLVDDTDIYRKNQCWACESVGFFREQIPGALAISEDGTLLAVAFDSCVTLWDPDTNELKATLTPHHCEKHIIHLLFGLESCSHFIIGASSDCLYIWNVLSLTVCWSIMLHVSVLVQCPCSDIFAVFTDKRQMHVYTPKSQKPLWSSSNPISKSDIKAAIFITSSSSSVDSSHECSDVGDLLPWQHVAELFYINKNHEFLTLDTQKREPQTPSTSVLSQNLPQTPFSVILSGKAKMGRTTQETKLSEDGRHNSARHFLKEILSTPAHVLPPVSSLAMNLMSTLLTPNNSSGKEDPDDEDDNISNDKHQQNGIKSESDRESDDDENNEKDVDLPKRKPSTEEQSAASQEADEARTFAEKRHKEYLKFTGKTDPDQLFDWLC